MANPGDNVGRYRLDQRLGSASGQGAVFRAHDERGFQYALKIPHGADLRFHSELKAALAVNSAHVAKVWDFDLSTDPPFIAYAVVPGDPLNVVLAQRELDVRSLAAIFRDVAVGLRDIHAVSNVDIPQLCHGDVSLDNIMVTPRNDATLIDLGAARTGQNSTQSREIFGKYGYFAPEQLLAKDAGPPADVWQFGVTLAKAACGHSPFGTGPESLKRIIDDFPNLAGLPGEFEEVVLGCLTKDPAHRPTAAALESALSRILVDKAEVGEEPSESPGFVARLAPLQVKPGVRKSGSLRIATWNVNSIRSRIDRVEAWLERSDCDVLAIQETKANDSQFPVLGLNALGYEVAHHGLNQWNGVAIISRVGLADVEVGFRRMPLWGDPPAAEARAIGATCGGVRIWSLYVPNGRALGDPHLAYKLAWLERLRRAGSSWLAQDPDAQIALMGDWNIAPRDEDVWDMDDFANSTHVSPPERAAFQAILDAGFTDVARAYTQGPGVYTYWDYQQLSFPKRHGMRIDFVLGSPALSSRVRGASFDREERKGKGASDHVPIVVELAQP